MRLQLSLLRENILVSASLILLLALIAVTEANTGLNALLLIRLILSIPFILFLSGYDLHLIVFPQNDQLTFMGRLALSLGLSFAIDISFGIVVDYLRIGLTLPTILTGVLLLTVIFGIAASIVRGRLHVSERFLWSIDIDPGGWWKQQEKTDRILFSVLAGTAIISLIAAITIAIVLTPASFYTDFYLLNSDGKAEQFPFQTRVNLPVSVNMDIVNHEGSTISYTIEVQQDNTTIATVEPFQVPNGQTTSKTIVFTPTIVNDNLPIMFVLYRDNQSTAYRILRLWMKVTN